jgi:hypothetical protein
MSFEEWRKACYPGRTSGARLRAILVLGVSGFATAFGLDAALTYQARPGAPNEPRAEWPDEPSIGLDPERATLVLALHPRCPCSRATLAELERLLARWPESLQTHVLFYADPALGPHWHETDLWRRAASLPGAGVHVDELGQRARSLGAKVSGTALLYSREGKLLFEGGLTAARGHEGANPGTDAIAAILSARTPETRSAPVYGCALFEDVAPSHTQP